MMTFLIILNSISVVLLIILLLQVNRTTTEKSTAQLQQLLTHELRESRIELSASMRDNRDETASKLNHLTEWTEQRLAHIGDAINRNSFDSRLEIKQTLQEFGNAISLSINEFSSLQKEKFAQMEARQDKLIGTTEEKLDQMRQTVDEKLHKTLEERLGHSFKLVSERLEAVQRGLGEMQTLANGVGDLKKVLSNVKTRGILGEIQLESILEQVMAPEQYATNVKINLNSADHVEFAIKLPGRDEDGSPVYLPVDAKFPQEDYIRLQNAYEAGDKDQVEATTRALAQSVKKFAKDISEKYLAPPHTTDFGIMFLPVEGLYAEIVRHTDLITQLQREHKIIVTGPTTLAAMLNSLQMGFRTLAIQKRSSEVWKVLGAVKSEFVTFGDVLEKAQKKINDANRDIDQLVGTRTRMMLSKLKSIETTKITERELPE